MGKLCTMKLMLRIPRSSSGFSLPELLLVTAILGYASAMVLLTFMTGTSLNEQSRNLISATSHAEFVMESVKNTAFSNLVTNINAGTWTWNTAAVTASGLIPLNSETITTTSTGTNPVDITVLVSWHDTKSRSRTKTLRTVIAG
jgi:prepilin-type N-terminal cleavage/methylation domain-containing protein